MNNFKKVVFLCLLMLFMTIACVAFAAEQKNVKEIAGDYYDKLCEYNYIDEECNFKATTSNENVSVKNIWTLGKDIIVVNFDSYFEKFDINDINLRAYNSDWYELSVSEKDISFESYGVTVNSAGETVLFLKINKEIDGNRLKAEYEQEEYSSFEQSKIIRKADNIITWQMDNGGWDKDYSLHSSRALKKTEEKNASSGWTSIDGTLCGTIDNGGTYTHMKDIALAYAFSGDEKYKESFEKGLEFFEMLQYDSGGFAQVYPKRGCYSDYVTFNDDAMINVLKMLEEIKEKSIHIIQN